MRDAERLLADIVAAEVPATGDSCDTKGTRAHKRIDHEVARNAALTDKHLAHRNWLLRWVPVVDPRCFDDVWDAEIGETTLALLEEQDALVSGSVVVPHPDPPLVPDKGFPEFEAACLGDWLSDEHRLLVTEEIEVRVLLQRSVDGVKELVEALIREDREPVVAGCLAVL
jgi:hypothetical protein